MFYVRYMEGKKPKFDRSVLEVQKDMSCVMSEIFT